jgi:hypothetical protein
MFYSKVYVYLLDNFYNFLSINENELEIVVTLILAAKMALAEGVVVVLMMIVVAVVVVINSSVCLCCLKIIRILNNDGQCICITL